MSFRRRMRSLPIRRVRIEDGFWSVWQNRLIESALPHQYRMLEETHRLRNFEYAGRAKTEGIGPDLPFAGLYYNDSDVYKWLEGACFAVIARPEHPQLASLIERIDHVAGLIENAQLEDGYLDTYFQLVAPEMRYLNLNAMHELYCQGHFIEAALAHRAAFGHDRLLKVAVRLADHIDSVFGPGRRVGFCGHQEIELALLALAEAVHEPRYRSLARRMVELRGQRPSIFAAELADPEIQKLRPSYVGLSFKGDEYTGEYFQDHAPIRQQKVVVGHAVRAMYGFIAATELAEEMDAEEPGVEAALRASWENLTQKRMYVTGGIGPSAHNEGFTRDYDLPNATSYAETCAAIGLALWGRRLTECSGESEFIDVAERALYNAALAGISLSGDRYFYANPLESRSEHQRVPWFECACCPPNLVRMIGSISNWAIHAGERDLWIQMPVGLTAEVVMEGHPVRIQIESNYPWSGEAKIQVSASEPVEFALRIRIPDWCDDAQLDVVGSDQEADFADGYAVVSRTWSETQTILLELEAHPKWISSHPQVLDNVGRLALTYGPIVYTLEEPDQTGRPQRLLLNVEEETAVEFKSELLGGVNVIRAVGFEEVGDPTAPLYEELGEATFREANLTFVPYFAWGNRGPSHMQVWVRS